MKSLKHLSAFVLLVVSSSSIVQAELAKSNQLPLAYQTQPIQLAMSIKAQQAFVSDVKTALVQIDSKLASKLCLNLLPDSRSKPQARCGTTESARVQVYVATAGHITHSYANDASAFYRPISMGSVAKILGLYVLARTAARTHESWCVKSFAELGNADGFLGYANCNAPGAYISGQRATATSNNLAFRWRIAQVEANTIRAELADIGVTNITTDTHPAAAVATGVVEVSPWLMLTLLSAVVDDAPPNATSFSLNPNFSVKAKTQFETLRQRLTPEVRAYIRELLQEPIRHPNGTVRHLAGALSKFAIAKSGTPTGSEGQTTGKLLIFSDQRPDGNWSTALIAIQSPKPSAALGKNLSGSDFSALHKLAVEAGIQPLSSALTAAVKVRGRTNVAVSTSVALSPQ